MAVYIDINRCIGCRSCEVACQRVHGGHGYINVHYVREYAAVPVLCHHCQEAGCTMVCFTGALYKEGERTAFDVEKCTGCGLCVQRCPAKNKADPSKKAINMAPQFPLRAPEAANWKFFLGLPEADAAKLNPTTIQGSQLKRPLFEFSGACAGCGETPYLKLLTQLAGDRLLIGNATGCSSIYGGNLPTTPFTRNKDGRGPTWNNSLFEDNAEFGMGFRLTIDQQTEYAKVLLKKLAGKLPGELVSGILEADQKDEAGIYAQRERVVALKDALGKLGNDADAKNLLTVADMLVKKSVWIVGGDGWAYDIGYGGLDHVLALG